PVVPPVVAPNPHGLAPSWWTLDATPGRPRLLLASAVVGLLAALLVADHVPGFGYVLVLLAGGAVVWAATGWRRDPFTVACGLLAAALVAVLMIRAAEWIGILCALAATVLCLVGTTRARTFAGIAFTGLLWPFTALHSLPWLGRTIRAMGGRGHGLSVARTVALSLVGVVAFGLLFASADALFASWVGAIVPDLGDALLLFRIFVGVAVGGLVLATSYLALNPPAVDGITGSTPRPVQRRYEWLVPVLLVDLVFVAFLAAQATAFFGGHDFVRRTTGLTYADYVHQGFGQLTVATVLTLIVVSIGFRKAPRATTADRAWLRGSLGLLCALTLVVVASALHRMDLYQEAYGFSRLRLLVDAFEIWLGLLVVAVVVAGIRLRGSWLPRLALLSGATVLLVLAVSNPDARIAQHNVERWQETGKIDVAYLDGLSDDATPALLDLPRNLVSCLRLTSDATPFWDWNLGRQHARDALAAAPVSTPPCAESGPRA
ncbi:MAG: histidine kinase, partial [Nocardioidaceae bacterium]|nr:histidine kinase [Nocardioidaceae bacterium]